MTLISDSDVMGSVDILLYSMWSIRCRGCYVCMIDTLESSCTSLETCRDGVPSMNNGRVVGVRASCELLLFSCRTRGHDFSLYSLPVDATVAWNFCHQLVH